MNVRSGAAWTSKQAAGEGCGDLSTDGGDRVADVALGSDGRMQGVVNGGEWEVPGPLGDGLAPRGEGPPARR